MKEDILHLTDIVSDQIGDPDTTPSKTDRIGRSSNSECSKTTPLLPFSLVTVLLP